MNRNFNAILSVVSFGQIQIGNWAMINRVSNYTASPRAQIKPQCFGDFVLICHKLLFCFLPDIYFPQSQVQKKNFLYYFVVGWPCLVARHPSSYSSTLSPYGTEGEWRWTEIRITYQLSQGKQTGLRKINVFIAKQNKLIRNKNKF